MSYKYRIIGAIIGFLVFNIIGAIIGYFIGQAVDEEQFKQKYKPRRPSAKKTQTSPSNTTKSIPSTLKSKTTENNTTKQQTNNSTSLSLSSNTKQCQQDENEFVRPAQKYKILGKVTSQSQTTAHPNKSLSAKFFGNVETSFKAPISSPSNTTKSIPSTLKSATAKSNTTEQKPNNSTSPSNTEQYQQDKDEFERPAQKYKILGKATSQSQTTVHPNKSISAKFFGNVETSFKAPISSPSNTTKSIPSTLKSKTTENNTTKQQTNNSTFLSLSSNTEQCQQDKDEFERPAQKYKILGKVTSQSQTTVHPNKSLSAKFFGNVETSLDDFVSSLQGKTNRTRSHLEERVQQELALGNLKSNDLKPNWKSYLDIIQRNNVSCLYHFTATKNINQIKKSGGLLSWYAAEQLSVGVPVFGGDSLSRNLDRRFGNHDYVHLSLCDDHPMAYRLKQNGEEVVVLKINPIVVVLKDTIFSDINAADRSHQQGGDIEDLKRINFEATKMRFVSRDDPNFKPHQAEVMVKRFLPARYIKNLNSL